MARKKRRLVNLFIAPTAFNFLFRKISGQKTEEYDFSGIKELRQLLSNEKAKLLYVIKNQEPDSLYQLSKLVKRDFKSVIKDIKILEKFGLVSLKSISKGHRKLKKPLIEIDELVVSVNF